MPLVSLFSYLEPVPTKTITVNDWLSFSGTVIILNPFFRVVFLNILFVFCLNVTKIQRNVFQDMANCPGKIVNKTIYLKSASAIRTVEFVHFFQSFFIRWRT